MTLRDLQRMTEAIFGTCPGCDACDACRAQGLVKMAWETGRRSGSASAADRSARKVRWDEWDWTTANAELVQYAMRSGSFASTDPVRAWVASQVHAASLWATSKGVKREDWTAFMQAWMLRRLPPPSNLQPDLFAGSSMTSSAASPSSTRQTQRKHDRSAAAMRLLKGGRQ